MVEVLVSSVCLVIVSTEVASAVQFTASQGREQRIRAFLVGELKSMSRQVQSEAQRGRFPVSSNVVLTSPEWGQYRVANVVTVDPSDPHRFANNIQVNLVNNPTKSVFLRTVVRAADVFTITAIPWTTFGIEQDGTGRMPTVIRLSEYGIRPGDRLRMLAVGGHSHHKPSHRHERRTHGGDCIHGGHGSERHHQRAGSNWGSAGTFGSARDGRGLVDNLVSGRQLSPS